MSEKSPCDPTGIPPEYLGKVPGPAEVIGAGFQDRMFTLQETWRYLDAVEASSDRVVTGTLGASWSGNGLRYAVVGSPHRITAAGLRRARAQARLLRDPRASHTALAATLADAPAIAWVGAGVHGNEPAGTNAALWLLRDLADRRDCAAQQILRNTLVVILPVQNPDGFATGRRNNSYGFDVNREWFAATQREMRGKLELLQQYPPVLFMDLHEMSGTSYFFPPYVDPVHHEVPAPVLEWIGGYGTTMADEFHRNGADFFTGTEFDLLYPGFGDSTAQLSTLSAGMTFEKGVEAAPSERVGEHHTAPWVSLSALAVHRERILGEWHGAHVTAYEQGLRGELEPNSRTGTAPPPSGPPVPEQPLRHYFLYAEVHREFELSRLLHRLQLAGVAVHRLTHALTVPDFRPYGGRPTPTTLPAGTYWIPLAQARKHWVQAMLGEQSYPSTTVFTDVGAWSLPLLGNISGGSSGTLLNPRATPAPRVTDPEMTGTHPPAPNIGLLRLPPDSPEVAGPYGWTLHQLDNVWGYPHTDLRVEDINPETLGDISVLLVPDGGSADLANKRLGDAGRAALKTWVNAGGRYVGWRGSVHLAALAGITTAGYIVPEAVVPGAFVRTRADTASPLTAEAGPLAWQFYFNDLVLYPTDPSHAILRYPPVNSPDWSVAGFALDAHKLADSAAIIAEPVGTGHVVLFGSDPIFRGMADGTAKILRNAITASLAAHPAPSTPPGATPTPHARKATPAAARLGSGSTFQVVVRPADAARTRASLRSFDATWQERPTAKWISFLIDNPADLKADHRHRPWSRKLSKDLAGRGVTPLAIAPA